MPTQVHQVSVTTSARLHMGFFDLSGSDFGSVGLAIDAPQTQIEITKSENTLIDAKSNQSVAKIVENLVKLLNIEESFSLKIEQSIPEHAGLGSGTQMALAIGAGLNALFDLRIDVNNIALQAKRGGRSGIGIAAFSQGGFLVDAGKTVDNLPEIAFRQDFPVDWRVLLVQDSAHVGVHGAVELNAFNTLKPAQNSLRDMVFSHMQPALQRADLLAFGAYMADLQAYNGDYFAPIQGGRFASQDVADVLHWLQANGAACVGQSSWGPTGFAILESETMAEALQASASKAFASKSNISFQIVRGKNTGASIQLG
jgi:beta-ribofuranosylaminobenzene 5'-phosphate synthase